MRYFAYGSNMSRARLETRVGPVVDLGRARCPGRRHAFSKLGRDGTGKGNIEVVRGELVWGVVYELESPQLERLIELEFGYRLIELELETTVLSFEALEPCPGLAPSREYLEHYVAGIREHQIPDAYLAAVLGEFVELLG
ncbi:MAG TPA: gamma-glutamylcyclotransferase family protein [Enhygromyxa sp.]|nr:gamma-glutamylcyclotransferase family protein [Enhygromyxa sp.]